MNTSQKQTSYQYYKNLDISNTGQPTGIDRLPDLTQQGACYCIITQDNIVQRVDVYQNGVKTHYKQFGYDEKGRVVKNIMYTPDQHGNWKITDDIWYYAYGASGNRSKKIMKLPGVSTATEVSYDNDGNRIQQHSITVTPDQLADFYEMV